MDFDLFKNSNKSIDIISDYVHTRVDDPNLYESNVIDEDNLDDWTLDDFFTALPKTIKDSNDIIYSIHLGYLIDTKDWYAGYLSLSGDFYLLSKNVDKYECLKELYFKIK